MDRAGRNGAGFKPSLAALRDADCPRCHRRTEVVMRPQKKPFPYNLMPVAVHAPCCAQCGELLPEGQHTVDMMGRFSRFYLRYVAMVVVGCGLFFVASRPRWAG